MFKQIENGRDQQIILIECLYSLQMGSSNSTDQIQKIPNSEWHPLKTEAGTEIVHNPKTKTQAEIRVIGLDPKHDIQKQKSIYTYRKNTNLPLVKALAAQFSQSQNRTLCGNQQNVRVLTQRILWRLDGVRSLAYEQMLYVLTQALAGFHDLYQKAGVFDVTDKMIGFNTNGETKVWLNENFAQNHPITQRPILQTTLTTPQPQPHQSQSPKTPCQKMISQIITLIESKCPNKKKVENLNKVLQNKSKSFEQAYHCVEDYIRDQGVQVPDRIQFGKEIREDGGGIEGLGQVVGNGNGNVNGVGLDGRVGSLEIGNRERGGYRDTGVVQLTHRSIQQPVYSSSLTPRMMTNTTIQPASYSRVYHSPPSTRLYPHNHATNTVNIINTPFNIPNIPHIPQAYNYGIISRPLSPRHTTTSRPISFNYQSPSPQTLKY